MKEATGELNMTVITVLIIAALGVVLVTIILPIISGSMGNSAKCATAFGCGACQADGKMECSGWYEGSGAPITNQTNKLKCPCK